MQFTLISNRTLQVLGLIVTLLFVSYIVKQHHYRFKTFEAKPDVYEYSEDKKLKYDLDHTVNCGLFIQEFSEFDMVYDNFIMDAIVWFDYNADIIPTCNIKKFSFDKGTIVNVTECFHKKNGSRTFDKYDVRVQFKSALDHHFFPIDDHRLHIVLTNECVDAGSILFQTSKSKLNLPPGLYTHEYEYVNHEIYNGYSTWELDKQDSTRTVSYPEVVFAIDFEKAGFNKFIAIFLPLFLLFFLSLFSLTISFSKDNMRPITSMCIGALSALIFYRLSVERITPDSSYFMLSDKLYAFFLSAAFTVLCIQIYLYHFLKSSASDEGTEPKLRARIDHWRSILYWVCLATVIAVTYLHFP